MGSEGEKIQLNLHRLRISSTEKWTLKGNLRVNEYCNFNKFSDYKKEVLKLESWVN